MKKRSLKLLSLAMSGVLTFSSFSSMTAFAAPEEDFGDKLEEQFETEAEDIDDVAEAEQELSDVEEEDIDSVEITTEELVPPIDVKWEAPGVYSFVVNSTQEMFYGSEVYYNGERWGHATFGSYISKEGIGYKKVDHYESCFLESGTYTVKIYVAATDSQDAPKVYAAEIPEISWTRPDNKISAPINLHWEKKDDEHFAIVACDPVEHAYAYSFSLYNDQGYVSGVYTINNYFDFSDKIGDMSNNDYYVTACAYSDDLYKYANSDLSEKSPSLTINGGMFTTQKDIVDIGKNVNAGNIDEKVQQVKDIDNVTLKSSLQTSNEALQAMGKIEDEYKNAKGIEVLPATSDVEKIPANKIEMTGAALNVSEGTVQLNVKDQKEAGSDIINTNIYTNIIAFDMSVKSSEGIDFSKELEVPVTISMPIPEGMDSSRLVILHYRADGAEELITPRIENGKAIFAITHFSTFALAEKKESSGADSPAPRIIVASDGSSKVYQNGVEIQNYTGLAMLGTTETAPWVYVENNKRNETYSGFVDYDGETFYVAGGTMATDLNGLQVDPSNGKDWYFLAGGQVQKHHEGLALYNGEWFYIKDGRLDTNLNAYVDYDGGKFFVGAGRIIQEYNGLAQDPQNTVNGDWYFLANGQAQTQYTGLAFYDNAWFYVINGKLAIDYTGTVDYDGATFNVVCGMVQESTAPATEPTTDPVITPEPKEMTLASLTNDEGYVVFGRFEQDGNLENGAEPIEWEIAGSDENGTLLVSRYILDKEPSVMISDEYENFEHIKNWLNSFYNISFSDEEKLLISDNESGKCFILSVNNLKKYYKFSHEEASSSTSFFEMGFVGYSKELIIAPTVYAEQQGVLGSSISREEYEEKYRKLGYGEDAIGAYGASWVLPDKTMQATAMGFVHSYVLADGCVADQAKYVPVYTIKPGIRPAMYIKK